MRNSQFLSPFNPFRFLRSVCIWERNSEQFSEVLYWHCQQCGPISSPDAEFYYGSYIPACTAWRFEKRCVFLCSPPPFADISFNELLKSNVENLKVWMHGGLWRQLLWLRNLHQSTFLENFRLGILETPDRGKELLCRAGTIIHLGCRKYQIVLLTMHETSVGNCVLSHTHQLSRTTWYPNHEERIVLDCLKTIHVQETSLDEGNILHIRS